VLELLARRSAMEPARFQAAMDDAVRFAIRLQEIAGMDVVSDGECAARSISMSSWTASAASSVCAGSSMRAK